MRRRPSKISMLRRLKSDLAKEDKGIGVDAASSYMKYRRFFKTKQYFGIDFNEDSLRKGLQRYPQDTGIIADLSKMELPENSVDVCVSTNTLEHLVADDQKKVIKNFVSIIKPTGTLILTKDRDMVSPALLEILKASFQEVEIFYYRNFLSEWYESLFVERDGKLTNSWMTKLLPLKLITIMLSWLESLTSKAAAMNDAMYIRCTSKVDVGQEREFTLDNAVQVTEKLFKLKIASSPRQQESSMVG